MSWAAVALSVTAAAFAVSTLALIIAAIRDRRERKRERQDERDRRLARYHEHVAADNGRPTTDAITMRATRRN